MKKLIFMLSLAVFAFAGTTNAQMGPLSIGAEVALPMGDFGDAFGLGAGVSVTYDHPLSDNFALGAHLGYIALFPSDDVSDLIKSGGMIPIQLSGKYFFDEVGSGAYAQGMVGVTSLSITTEDFEAFGITVEGETDSETNLSFGFGGGFIINEKLDLGLRYSIITAGDEEGAEASNYIGVRIGYIIAGGN